MQRKWTSTDEDDRQFAREWAYTAVTRAVEDVRIWVI
jgi:ATP-dependent exoDNAse (exonuclease V) alpha subunit